MLSEKQAFRGKYFHPFAAAQRMPRLWRGECHNYGGQPAFRCLNYLPCGRGGGHRAQGEVDAVRTAGRIPRARWGVYHARGVGDTMRMVQGIPCAWCRGYLAHGLFAPSTMACEADFWRRGKEQGEEPAGRKINGKAVFRASRRDALAGCIVIIHYFPCRP